MSLQNATATWQFSGELAGQETTCAQVGACAKETCCCEPVHQATSTPPATTTSTSKPPVPIHAILDVMSQLGFDQWQLASMMDLRSLSLAYILLLKPGSSRKC